MGTLNFAGAANAPAHNSDFQPFRAFLLNGASNDGAIDASGGAVDFEVDDAAATSALIIRELIVAIEDQGSIDVGRYGNGVQLTTGINVEWRNAADAVQRTLSAAPIITNMDWASHMGGEHTLATFGSGANHLFIRVPIDSHGEQGLLLTGGDKLVVVLEDNFTNLTAHTFLAVGYHD